MGLELRVGDYFARSHRRSPSNQRVREGLQPRRCGSWGSAQSPKAVRLTQWGTYYRWAWLKRKPKGTTGFGLVFPFVPAIDHLEFFFGDIAKWAGPLKTAGKSWPSAAGTWRRILVVELWYFTKGMIEIDQKIVVKTCTKHWESPTMRNLWCWFFCMVAKALGGEFMKGRGDLHGWWKEQWQSHALCADHSLHDHI